MATISSRVQDLLEANSALIALVPTARIKPPGPWQNLARPYCVHFIVAAMPVVTYTGTSSAACEWLIQVSSFADSLAAAMAVAAEARAALDGRHANGVSGFWNGDQVFYEDDTKIYQVASMFQIFGSLS